MSSKGDRLSNSKVYLVRQKKSNIKSKLCVRLDLLQLNTQFTLEAVGCQCEHRRALDSLLFTLVVSTGARNQSIVS